MEKMKCQWCGKEFEQDNRGRKYCCTECRVRANSRKNKEKDKERRAKKKAQKKDKLGMDIKEARAEGLTYGKYKAKRIIAEYGRVNVVDIMAELEGKNEGSKRDSQDSCAEGSDSGRDIEGNGCAEKSDLCDTAEA